VPDRKKQAMVDALERCTRTKRAWSASCCSARAATAARGTAAATAGAATTAGAAVGTAGAAATATAGSGGSGGAVAAAVAVVTVVAAAAVAAVAAVAVVAAKAAVAAAAAAARAAAAAGRSSCGTRLRFFGLTTDGTPAFLMQPVSEQYSSCVFLHLKTFTFSHPHCGQYPSPASATAVRGAGIAQRRPAEFGSLDTKSIRIRFEVVPNASFTYRFPLAECCHHPTAHSIIH
jgi:hypothetical protein